MAGILYARDNTLIRGGILYTEEKDKPIVNKHVHKRHALLGIWQVSQLQSTT